MNAAIQGIGYLLAVVFWIAGIVLAKGFWSTLCAALLPPWAWYLVAELAMHRWGLI